MSAKDFLVYKNTLGGRTQEFERDDNCPGDEEGQDAGARGLLAPGHRRLTKVTSSMTYISVSQAHPELLENFALLHLLLHHPLLLQHPLPALMPSSYS